MYPGSLNRNRQIVGRKNFHNIFVFIEISIRFIENEILLDILLNFLNLISLNYMNEEIKYKNNSKIDTTFFLYSFY